MAYDYDLLQVKIDNRLAVVTINNPPINLMTPQLYGGSWKKVLAHEQRLPSRRRARRSRGAAATRLNWRVLWC